MHFLHLSSNTQHSPSFLAEFSRIVDKLRVVSTKTTTRILVYMIDILWFTDQTQGVITSNQATAT
jgi:hypothetical protein